jgi:hypothetical protein
LHDHDIDVTSDESCVMSDNRWGGMASWGEGVEMTAVDLNDQKLKRMMVSLEGLRIITQREIGAKISA